MVECAQNSSIRFGKRLSHLIRISSSRSFLSLCFMFDNLRILRIQHGYPLSHCFLPGIHRVLGLNGAIGIHHVHIDNLVQVNRSTHIVGRTNYSHLSCLVHFFNGNRKGPHSGHGQHHGHGQTQRKEPCHRWFHRFHRFLLSQLLGIYLCTGFTLPVSHNIKELEEFASPAGRTPHPPAGQN